MQVQLQRHARLMSSCFWCPSNLETGLDSLNRQSSIAHRPSSLEHAPTRRGGIDRLTDTCCTQTDCVAEENGDHEQLWSRNGKGGERIEFVIIVIIIVMTMILRAICNWKA